MDYFSVFVLIIVAFIFVSDRNVKSLDLIRKEKPDLDITCEMNYIKENMEIIKIKDENMDYYNFLKFTKDIKKQYIFLQNKELDLTENEIDTLIANYIASGKRSSGFNLLYHYGEKKWSFKKIYIDIINYLNIFNKTEITTYGVILCTKENLKEDERKFKNDLVSYTSTEITNIATQSKEIKTDKLKNIYLDKITNANISIVIKILFLIISGSIITTNLIYNMLNVNNNNINGLIISIVIYYCYSYIIRYIYKPIGKKRIIATYIFPIYFLSYVIVGIYTLITKVINKVQAS